MVYLCTLLHLFSSYLFGYLDLFLLSVLRNSFHAADMRNAFAQNIVHRHRLC